MQDTKKGMRPVKSEEELMELEEQNMYFKRSRKCPSQTYHYFKCNS